ncbi:low molecular weight protein arginine phosphatase [Brevibacillus daliensis]|uniref:low molecular weight protein arginine phosphatase n=1 Tax=Brevibacillus daliensis TaxID=2892995 RepID=UPI001E29570D|nr:low molecular weight protein arginine phosphatase [Brevibacillus daliensis]
MRILFVCTGNTCRSPMAEAIFREKTKDMDLMISSAGVAVFEGQQASLHAQQVLEEKGINYQHTATQLKEEGVKEADLIITMTQGHKATILAHFPEIREKIFSLKEYAYGTTDDISDPFGGSLDIYRMTAEEMEKDLHVVMGKIKEQK